MKELADLDCNFGGRKS